MKADPYPARRFGFTGSRAAQAPLSWAQQGMWTEIVRALPDNGYLNTYSAVPIPGGRDLDDVLAAVARVVSAHESLRTTFAADSDGVLVQRVHRTGEFRVPLIEIDPADVDTFLPDHADDPFDHAVEWPIRFAVATSGGRPASLLVVVSHLIVDGLARDLLMDELTARLAGRTEFPEPGLTPVDIAWADHSAEGAARNARAIRRWRRFLDAYEVTNFPRPVRPAEPRWTRTTLGSPALGLAVTAIAARNRVTTPAVYLGLSATALSALTERPTGVLLCMCSNRLTPAERACIGNLTSACPAAVAVGRGTVDQVVRNAMTAGIQAYAMARYRTEEVHAIVPPHRFDTLHNDFRAAGGYPVTAPHPASIESARARTAIGAAQPLSFHTDKIYYEIRHLPDGPEPFAIVDRHHLPVDGDELLAAIEQTAISAAMDDGPTPAAELFRRALDRGAAG